MKLIDLFSGIGGFSLAAHWMGWETIAFVEKDAFCQKVLAKNFSGIPIYGDIHQFDGKPLRGTADIISGGFPCQPYSSAGHRRGGEDDRAIWPQMLRVITEVKPKWIVGENVVGFIAMGLDDLLDDLEAIGYEATPFVIPACGVGAEQRRERVWIIGNSEGRRFLPQPLHDRTGVEIDVQQRSPILSQNALFEVWDGTDAGTNGNGDGLPAKLDKRKLGSDSRYEPQNEFEARLKALGNTIDPYVALEIFRAIEKVGMTEALAA